MPSPVIIKSGETVHFPVASDHPLAQYQQLVNVADFKNLHDLALVRTITAVRPELTTQQVATAVNGVLASGGISHIIHLIFPDITVEQGATLVWSGPINYVQAGNIIVDGEILVYGSLNLNCLQLGGSQGSGSGAIGGGGGGGSGGGPVGRHGPHVFE